MGKNTNDKQKYRRMCKHLNLLKEFFAIGLTLKKLSFETVVEKRSHGIPVTLKVWHLTMQLTL